MNISKKTVEHSKQSGTPGVDKFAPASGDRGIVCTLVRFVTTLNAALVVARWSDYYYMLSDHQLAHLGLTREDVPTNLLRVLNQYQNRPKRVTT